MVKSLKTSAAKRLFNLVPVLGLFVSLTFDSSLSLAADAETRGQTHELIIRTEEILAALENGSAPLGDSFNGTTSPKEGSPSPSVTALLGQSSLLYWRAAIRERSSARYPQPCKQGR